MSGGGVGGGGVGGGGATPGGPYVFLDIDIDCHREAHQRAVDFVSQTSLKYGLSSPLLSELGGSERARLPELYASDHAWASRGRLELSPAPFERVRVELFAREAPNCAANFAALCSGAKGRAKGSGVPLHYKGSVIHRVVAGAFLQGGDFTHGNGAGGECIWGAPFKDEKEALKRKVDEAGLLCMSNTGKNSNGSQFFFTLAPLPKLSGKHCVFGRVVAGMEVLLAVGDLECSAERPLKQVRVVDCGVL